MHLAPSASAAWVALQPAVVVLAAIGEAALALVRDELVRDELARDELVRFALALVQVLRLLHLTTATEPHQ